MTDDGFHLTPLDVRRYDFGNALRGYDRSRVDHFREQVANELERLARQAQQLEAKAQSFHEQLRAFRERDKAINEALVSAQQLRAEVKEQAERESQLILREARAEGERLVALAQNEVRKLESDIEALGRQRRSFLSQVRSIVERQLADLEAAEGSAASAPARPEPAEPAVSSGAAVPAWLDSLVRE